MKILLCRCGKPLENTLQWRRQCCDTCYRARILRFFDSPFQEDL